MESALISYYACITRTVNFGKVFIKTYVSAKASKYYLKDAVFIIPKLLVKKKKKNCQVKNMISLEFFILATHLL